MYLTHFDVENIKCFKHASLKFPHHQQDFSGWNVILGGNGTGKSTLLQAMAISLIGPVVGQRLLYNPAGWTRRDYGQGDFRFGIVPGNHDSAVGQPRKKPYAAAFAVTGTKEVEIDGQLYDQPQLVQMKEDRTGMSKGPYSANRPGWLCCGYGPFRRLTGMGGTEEYDLVYGPGRGKRFATLFREGAAITNGTEWLISLYSRSVDPHENEGTRFKLKDDLELIIRVINDLLPGDVRLLRVDSKSVFFRTIGGVEVGVPELSDGYRSFLALAIDLLRHVHDSVTDFAKTVDTDTEAPHVTMDGVVLIDEVDAHLHPRWQREIGFRLCQAFPKIQFIVTSHSPFVAQAANDNGLFVLRQAEGHEFIEALQPMKSVRGWRVDQVLTSRMLFDLDGTRDAETEQLMKEHSELVAKREWSTLNDTEQSRLIGVEQKLSERLTAPGESVEERTRQVEMQQYVKRTLETIGSKG